MQSVLKSILDEINHIILGKEKQVKLALSCLLAEGHLLIEDIPGMGKTTLAHAFAKVLGFDYRRVQFTSDMLPADILGLSIYKEKEQSFVFSPGPIFSQLLLADEINRATPKTQSALLEAMEERQVSIDGETRELPKPFFVIATQNPVGQMGTFSLPESQLDRFLMTIQLGYPEPEVERQMLLGKDGRAQLKLAKKVCDLEEFSSLQKSASQVHASDDLIAYIQRLVEATRTSSGFVYGLSPRGTLGILRASKAWAYVNGRDHVLPEDVQMILPAVAEHRLRGGADHADDVGLSAVQKLLSSISVI